MKTLQQCIDNIDGSVFDGRDINRLVQFMTLEQIKANGLSFTDPADAARHVPIEFTREAILAQLEKDVDFGFEKALNQRGLSSGLMFEVVRMWNWVLEEGLEDYDTENGYAYYGLPLFRATAVKYGFANPIGDDTGAEVKYDTQY